MQGVAAVVDDRDRVTLCVRERWDDGHAERLEALGRAVLSHDRRAFAGGVVQMLLVEVVLEEIGAAGGGYAVTVVQEALVERFAGERFTGVRVAAQHLADRRNRRVGCI